MSFTSKATDKFSTVFDRSPYQIEDPIVKLRRSKKGSNIIIGRDKESEDYSNLIYLGKVVLNRTWGIER